MEFIMKRVIVGACGLITLIFMIVRGVHFSRWLSGIRAFAMKFVMKYKRNLVVKELVVPDDRKVVYYSDFPTSIYYPAGGYQVNDRRKTVNRYSEDKKDYYGKVSRFFVILLLILSELIALVAIVCFVFAIVMKVTNIAFDPFFVWAFNYLGKIEILVPAVCFFAIMVQATYINSKKIKYYFGYKKLYTEYINNVEMRKGGDKLYVKVA